MFVFCQNCFLVIFHIYIGHQSAIYTSRFVELRCFHTYSLLYHYVRIERKLLFRSGQAGIRSRFAVLSVLVPPDPPKILQGPRLTATEDQEIELECISVGGKPAAEVHTYIFICIHFVLFICENHTSCQSSKTRK